MPRGTTAAIPAAIRKTLLEWIEHDDGDTTSTQPVCSEKDQALHASILLAPYHDAGSAREPLEPPAGLRLAPLG
jgi:hypothetical protein